MYRCHPQTARLVELIRSKAIGDVCVIHATFSFAGPSNEEARLLKNSLGGGGILDVGCYCVSIARLVAGAALGKDFAEPVELTGCGKLNAVTGADEWAIASLKFPGGIVAELSTGVRVQQENVVRIYGAEGSILVPDPWLPARNGGATCIRVWKRGQSEPQEIAVQSSQPLYAIEADVVAAHIADRQAPPGLVDTSLERLQDSGLTPAWLEGQVAGDPEDEDGQLGGIELEHDRRLERGIHRERLLGPLHQL